MPKGESKKRLLASYLSRTRPQIVSGAEFDALRRELAPISENYLRELLRASGVPLDPVVEGVRQDTLENLERSLLQLQSEYESADRARARRCRELVITAKDHSRLAMRRLAAGDPKRVMKEEMILWMLTWLENPPSFSIWLALRKRGAGGRG